MSTRTTSPKSPIIESQTSECGRSFDANDKDEVINLELEEIDEDDLFRKVVSMHKERESVALTHSQKVNRSRLATMGGFVVNQSLMLQLHIDDVNYITIPIRPDTKAKDAVHKIQTRRKIPSSAQCTLYQDGQQIDDNANLYEIMQITSGTPIQVRFLLNSNGKEEMSQHHLLQSIVKSETDPDFDDDLDDLDQQQDDQDWEEVLLSSLDYRKLNQQREKKKSVLRNRQRAFPNKINLVAINSFTVKESDDNDVARDQVLQNIESSLKQLPREQFHVTKINRQKRHQKRMLKLTEHGIENIRPATKGFFGKEEAVTSFHLWENVTNSYLEDATTIRISYSDYKEGDRKYTSQQANAINDSIQQRLKIIREHKVAGNRKEISVKFQKQLLHQQIQNAKIFNLADHVRLTCNRTGYIVYKGYVHYAPGEHYGVQLDEANGDHDGLVDGIRYFRTERKKAVLVPVSAIIRKIITKNSQQVPDKRKSTFSTREKMQISSPWRNGTYSPTTQNQKASKFNSVFGTESVEDTIYRELKSMILSNETTEGRYRNNFANKFYKYVKEENLLQLVRDFMDAVKAKILERHGAKYRELISIEWRKHNEAQKDKEREQEKEEEAEAEEAEESNNMDLANEMSKVSDTVNKLIESAIEETILQAKIKEIYKLCLDETQGETQILSLKMEKLRHRAQSYFGIKSELQSASNWNRAVYELSLLRDCTLPSEKINTLVNCAHAIYLSHAKEQREKEKDRVHNAYGKKRKREDFFITGDDFLPIVIYVIVQASKAEPCITDADLRFMEGLVDPAANRSEPGYYLAVFHAALQWIRCFNT